MSLAITFVLGGARSGKSAFAEHFASKVSKSSVGEPRSVVYLATAKVLDDEMKERIAIHQADRPRDWTTIEEALDPQNILQKLSQRPVPPVILIDCLSLLLSNWMFAHCDVQAQIESFLAASLEYPAPLIVVSNEVGSGIVPADALTRKYRDWLGWFNQSVARVAKSVLLVVAGVPVDLRKLEAKW
ncbi:bifunctional adenosylcobinamide kinase/adenosylcobinamide-phosphate guanylyltransferase [Alicyclobacillus sp. ALC3]|nr:bifunctional adenosylcobinamide kinase/adenosylcobinamide-phosphate guanylyltransferase [Alicyclobacillus sp. ALC3]WDL96532.1 bifunctional adenosylcobinamide kinase/adenosylcobinamide-phosphate guanylyltransferase [Alicyclobacillus sp. ALC3]